MREHGNHDSVKATNEARRVMRQIDDMLTVWPCGGLASTEHELAIVHSINKLSDLVADAGYSHRNP